MPNHHVVLPDSGRFHTGPKLFAWLVSWSVGLTGLLSQEPIAVESQAAAQEFSTVVVLGEAEVLDGDHTEVREFAGRYGVATVRSLLAHEESRVRAVAAAVLQLQLGAQSLPELLPLLDDEGVAPLNPDVSSVGPDLEHLDPQVGQLVAGILRHYLRASSVVVDREPEALRAAFVEYWRARKSRSQCLGWHKVHLQQAAGGPGPKRPGVVSSVAQLRKVLDTHPEPERSWYLLALASPWRVGGRARGAEHLATDAELIKVASSLRSIEGEVDPVMQLLQGRAPSDLPDGSGGDPDLRRGGTLPVEQIVCFILRNAPKILTPKDLPVLLELMDAHLQEAPGKDSDPAGPNPSELHSVDLHGDPIRTPLWCVAAADMDSARAREHLLRGFAAFPTGDRWLAHHQRMHLADAAWRLLGKEGLSIAVEWFFTDVPPGAMGVGRVTFARSFAAEDREGLLWTLAADPRSATLDPHTVRAMAESAHQHLGDASPFGNLDAPGMWVEPETIAEWSASLAKIGKDRLAGKSKD